MPTQDTRTAILDLAEELLRGRSFNAFSYQDIAERIGIRKASIHYHFASKEDLGVALIERFRRRAGHWASRLVEQQASPLQKLDAYIRIQEEVLASGEMICALGILGAEYNALPERMKDSYRDFLEEQQTWLGRLLAKGQDQGTFTLSVPPEEMAVLIQSSLQGALQLARASGRPDRFHAVVRGIRSGLLKSPTTPGSEEVPGPSGSRRECSERKS